MVAPPARCTTRSPSRTAPSTTRTIWAPDFSQAYYEDLLFNEAPGDVSMRNFYIEQSSGAYTVNGDVSDVGAGPVQRGKLRRQLLRRHRLPATPGGSSTTPLTRVRGELAPASRRRRSTPTSPSSTSGIATTSTATATSTSPTATSTTSSRSTPVKARRPAAAPRAPTPSGATAGTAYQGGTSPDGPGSDVIFPIGGLRIGESDFWIGDYTVEPENGGVGVFAHEFGHDLGLPDLYDTSGNTGGAENSTGFWTLYCSGSYGNSGVAADGIGSKPVHLGTWEKFQLGWLNYEVAFAGSALVASARPGTHNTKQAQGVFVVLPPRQVVPLDLGAPCDVCGTSYFYSGSGDDLNNTMTRAVAAGGALTAKVRYEIEEDWDYAFLEASSDGGTTWTEIATNLSDAAGDQSGFNPDGTGMTGTTAGAWLDLTGTLPAGTNAIRFRYQTDGAFVLPGFQVDNIAIDATLVGTAESDEGWTFDGFRITTGSETQAFNNYYVLENRQYTGYDDSLRTGPYNFGFLDDPDLQNWVEHFTYQDGLLVNYWDTQYTDNNVGDHPGEGLLLPVDAHPALTHWADGTLMRPRILSFDATFGLDPVPALTVHNGSVATTIPAQPAVKVFSDANNPWSNCDGDACTGAHVGRYQPGWYSVDIPNTGTTVRVKSISATGFMQVDINK